MLVMSVSIISYDNYYRYSVLEEKKDVLLSTAMGY